VRGQSPVAVLNYDAWRNRFGLDAGILGRTITMDDEPFTVVGVAQPGFHGVEVETSVEIWVPLTMNALATDDTGLVWLWAMGRRKPGVAEAKIQAEANTILSAIWHSIMASSRSRGLSAWPCSSASRCVLAASGFRSCARSSGNPSGC